MTEESPAIAELEVYGLPVRLINLLETRLGCIYLADLARISAEDIIAQREIGRASLQRIQQALRNYRNRHQVRTPTDCTYHF